MKKFVCTRCNGVIGIKYQVEQVQCPYCDEILPVAQLISHSPQVFIPQTTPPQVIIPQTTPPQVIIPQTTPPQVIISQGTPPSISIPHESHRRHPRKRASFANPPFWISSAVVATVLVAVITATKMSSTTEPEASQANGNGNYFGTPTTNYDRSGFTFQNRAPQQGATRSVNDFNRPVRSDSPSNSGPTTRGRVSGDYRQMSDIDIFGHPTASSSSSFSNRTTPQYQFPNTTMPSYGANGINSNFTASAPLGPSQFSSRPNFGGGFDHSNANGASMGSSRANFGGGFDYSNANGASMGSSRANFGGGLDYSNANGASKGSSRSNFNGGVDFYDANGAFQGSSRSNLAGGFDFSDANGAFQGSSRSNGAGGFNFSK